MNLTEASKLMALPLAGLTQEIINAKFAVIIHAAHPDTGVGGAVGTDAIDKAKKARNILREFVDKGGKAVCGTCNGNGRVRGVMGTQLCPACKGRG